MIAVTGMGAVSAFGVGVERFTAGIVTGQALNADTTIDLRRYGLAHAGFIRDFVAKRHIPAMKARRMSRYSQIAHIAAIEAWKASRLTSGSDREKRTAVIVGTGLGSVSSTDSFFEGLVSRGPLETNPMLFPETVQNIGAAHISIELGLRGPNTTFSQGDISGESAVLYAAGLLREGLVDAAMVCGVDELTEPLLTGLRALNLISRSSTLRPFDRHRDGIVPAEGAAAIVLERAQDARERGAAVFGYLRGFGIHSASCGRFSYADPGSMADAMHGAMTEAGTRPDVLSASANSSVALDRNEASAIRSVFGTSVPVTALKSRTGSFMASGVLKIIEALLCIREGTVPPIYGLADPEVPGIEYITGSPLNAAANACLINSFSHGGANLCIMVSGEERTS